MLNPPKITESQFFRKAVRVTGGPGALAVNVFKVHGAIRVIDQVATLIAAPTLVNCTGVSADFYDGTVARELTKAAPGATLSGMPVGTTFLKDQDIGQPYTVLDASACRVSELEAKPFTLVAKNGVDSFIRFHLTTTDAPVDFTMFLVFEWKPVDGGWLEALV